MKRLGRHAAWLGWVVAGVLALSAGGVAFAANNDRASNDQAPLRDLVFAQAQTTQPNQGNQGNQSASPRDRNGPRAFPGLRRGLLAGKLGGGQLLHSETTVQTKDGVKTFVLARGQVTALSGSSVTITSSDKVATTFAINGDTRYGFQNLKEPRAQLATGQTAVAIGTRSGNSTTANRILTQGS
jgi:hypothetical protein